MKRSLALKGRGMAGVRSGVRGVVFCFKDEIDFENVKLSPESRLQHMQVRDRA